MPVRMAEAKAVRRIIEDRFGNDHARDKRWVICGDMNDYRERVLIGGDVFSGFTFEPVARKSRALTCCWPTGFAKIWSSGGRSSTAGRSTIRADRKSGISASSTTSWLSPALAQGNAKAMPDIVRGGQPYRTPFPPGQEVERYPRIGWDRPKASDHCPVAVTLDMV